MDSNYVSRLDYHADGNEPEVTPQADPSPAQRKKKVTAKSIIIITLISMVVALGGGIAFFIIGRLGTVHFYKCVADVKKEFLDENQLKFTFHLEHNNLIFALLFYKS